MGEKTSSLDPNRKFRHDSRMLRYWMIIGLLLSATWLQAQGDSAHYYLLRTGYLLEGTATFDGRNYTVQTPFGSMNVPALNVEFVGKSKGDVYRYRRSHVDPANCNALIRFAEWCISNGLTEEGIAEYQRAGQAAHDAAVAGLIRQRLVTLLQGEPAHLPSEVRDAPPVLEVSRPIFENFARRVQPILVSRCVSTDCHGTSSDHTFKMGIPRESLGSTSRRNLQSVLAHVNLDDPLESPLLLALVTPHGGAKTALSADSSHYHQAARWVQQVAAEKAPRVETDIFTGTSLRVSALPEQFRQAIPKAERPNLPVPPQQGELDPLDPQEFNKKYHR